MTSNILNVTPDASFSLIINPELLLASTNIFHNGKLNAPGSLLSGEVYKRLRLDALPFQFLLHLGPSLDVT